MPFPFTLPTTSSVLLTDIFTSTTHPSLPFQASTKRSLVRDALKKHKRLPASSRSSHLPAVEEALTGYIPFLLSLNTASSYRDIGPERVDVEVVKPFEVEWRTTLSASIPGREAPRQKLIGLHHELAFVLSTLAYVQTLRARAALNHAHGSGTASADQRASANVNAMKHLLQAHSIHSYILSLPSISAARDAPVDVQPSTISALASMTLAEADLIFVTKDDPYAAAVADGRDEDNKDWMFKAPTVPKVRASLFARICLQAAEHASQACGLLASSKLSDDVVKYVNDLRRTSRGKAARFLAVEADLTGKTGEALAWLKGAKKELGLAVELEDGKRKGLRGLKQSWKERREDRKLGKDGEWGLDAGRLEEARIIETLETKWDRENNAVNVQVVPPFEPLLAGFPTGREPHVPQTFQPPTLDAQTLAQLRAPPNPSEHAFRGDEEDSGGEDNYGQAAPPGAFSNNFDQPARLGASASYY